MKTTTLLTLQQRAKLIWQANRFYFRYRIGQFVANSVRFFESYQRIMRQSDYDRLSPELLAEFQQVQHDQVDNTANSRARTWRIKADAKQDGKNHYALVARETEAILKATPLTPVAHVGARVDVVSEYLAKRFPELEFVSVDLQDNLEEHNQSLESASNWSFRSGYIIDMLEAGDISPKLLIMMYTACKMTPREVRKFFDLATPHINACVLLSSYKPNPLSPLKSNPDDIPDEETVLSAGHLLNPDLLQPFYCHNYRKILVERGFEILRSEIIQPMTEIGDGTGHLIVGRRD